MEEEEGQIRACSWMSSALIKMHHLNGYEEAEVIAARGAACKMGFFKTPTGDDYNPDDHDEEESPVSEATPGTFEEMPAGWEFQEYDPKHPITGFGEFVQAELRSMAAGLGVSYHTWSQNLAEANFGNLRAGLLDERDWWKLIQVIVIEGLHVPVWEAWLDMALLSGAVPLPYSKYDKFNAPVWHPRRWAWVDPLKYIKARQLEKAEGWTSDTDICAENGNDFPEIMSQRQQDRDTRAEYKEPANAPAVEPKKN
jgi:lambda family phage portal protein